MTFVLIGNKSDLMSQRAVTFDEGQSFANAYGMEFCETSAVQDLNVKVAFSKSAIRIMQKIKNGELTINKDGTQGVRANLAYHNGDFLPPAYLNELRGTGGDSNRSSIELKSKQMNEGTAECKCCGN